MTQSRRCLYYLAVIGSLLALPLGARTAEQETAKPAAQEPAGAGPQSPEYVFKTTTRLVILDIVATDVHDRVVADLKPEEVQILENGKEQIKRDFSFEHPGAAAAPHAVSSLLPPDVVTNVPQYSGNSSFNIILLDVLNSSFVHLAYAHDQLTKYLDDNPPSQPTAIFALGDKLWLLHDFTTDQQTLKEVVRRFKGQGSQIVTSSSDPAGNYKRKATFTVTPVLDRAWVTIDAFRSLSRIMAAYKGRKNLIWISESFVVDTMPNINAPRGPLSLSDFSRAVERTADAMMEAQIAIYPVDTGTLSGAPFQPMLSGFDAHSAMREVADRTGGKAFVNRNDLDMGIRSSIDDGSSYYTTSYTPSNKTWDGQMRKIEVKTTRAGVKLRYRKGYYAVDPSPGPPNKKEIKETSIDFAQALDPDLPVSTGVLFQARVVPPSEKTANKVVVNFAVDPHQVAFAKQEDSLQHAEVSCIAWAFPVKGKPVSSGGGTVKAAVDSPTFTKLMQSALPCNQSIDLQPGNYMLRLGVIDQSTRKIGALTAWVTVPGMSEPSPTAAQTPIPAVSK